MLLMRFARQRLGQEVRAVVFTGSMRQGDFSSLDCVEHGVEGDAKVLRSFTEVTALDHVDGDAGVGEEWNALLARS